MTHLHIREERMSGAFLKFHLEGPWPFHPVMHRFDAPDHGDAHDHPWAFRSIILHGGYVEEVFDLTTGRSEFIHRKPGDSFVNAADHVHRIVDLPEGECWTMILPNAWERTPGFYQVRPDGIYHRFWNQEHFERLELAE